MIRTAWGWGKSSLQTAITEMRHRETGRRVLLVAVVHIGSREYYAEIDRIIATHEAAGGVVLYEGLGSLSETEIAGLTPREQAIYRTLAPLHELYGALARSLDLVFQGDALHYNRDRWINADLPLRELLRRWADSGAPLLPLDAGVASLSVPDSALGRGLSAFALLQTPLMLAALNRVHGRIPTIGKLRELLLSDRNRAALDALETVDPSRDALVIYGAGHMAGLQEGLEIRGYVSGEQQWLTAFTMRLPWSEHVDMLREQTATAKELWRAARGR